MAYSIVILSCTAGNLVQCVTTLMSKQPRFPPERIVVVDDGARAKAESWLPDGISWVDGAKPFIYARNCNLGIAACAPDDVILLNDDALLMTHGGFDALSAAADAFREVGVLSAAVAGVVANPSQRPKGATELRYTDERLSFVCPYIRREVLDLVGQLDHRFVGYGGEDDDMCLRVQQAGMKLATFDGCVVDHSGLLPSTFRVLKRIDPGSVLGMKLFFEKHGIKSASCK